MNIKDEYFRRVKEPSGSMLDYYRKLYIRNQTKFMRRSKLTQDHLGSEFIHGDEAYILLGTVDAKNNMLVKNNNGDYFFVHSDIVDAGIFGK